MGLGELLDAAIRLFRGHWKTLMGIVALIQVPVTLLSQYVTNRFQEPFVFPTQVNPNAPPELPTLEAGDFVGLASVVVLAVVVTPFLIAAITRAVADAYLGRDTSVGAAYRFALRRFGSLLWVIFLEAVAIMVPLFLVAIVVVTAVGPAGVLLLFLMIIPAILFYFRWVFAPTTVVVEDFRGSKALGRSWALSRGAFWKIFGTMFVAGLLVAVVNAIFIVPATLLTSGSPGPNAWILPGILAAIASVVTAPFSTMIPVLLYFDQRIRKEGFDLAVLAEQIAPREG
jgi:hypothetical protein